MEKTLNGCKKFTAIYQLPSHAKHDKKELTYLSQFCFHMYRQQVPCGRLPIVTLQTKPFQGTQLFKTICFGTSGLQPEKSQSKKTGPFFPVAKADVKTYLSKHLHLHRQVIHCTMLGRTFNILNIFSLEFFLRFSSFQTIIGSKILALIKYSCIAFSTEGDSCSSILLMSAASSVTCW